MRRLSLLATTLALLSSAALAAPTPDDPPLEVSATDAQLVWAPTLAFDHLALTVSGPAGIVARRAFSPEEVAALDLAALSLPDGEYRYEATLVGLTGEHEGAVQTGGFVWADGAALVREAMDVVYADDLIVQGSECIGFDCVNGEVFAFSTLRLKENNLRIEFKDTSVAASFPTNDWMIQVNDSVNGGDSYFAIKDETAGTIPFRIEAGAPDDALRVDHLGRVGIGITNPSVELHVKDGDTPTLRLRQSNDLGYAPQTWDVAGNEANFFVRDVSNSSLLPFRIQPAAPTNSVYIGVDGVGIGKLGPTEMLDVDGNARLSGALQQIADYDTADDLMVILDTNDEADPLDDEELFRVDGVGNVFFAGGVNPSSSVHRKTDFLPVDNAQILRTVRDLPLSTWRYRGDAVTVRHLGPMAQDFYAAFGLGIGETTIATVDADGVALASIQALAAENDELRAQNAALAARLARLEGLVEALTSSNR